MIWINGTYTENECALSVYDKSNLGMSVFTTALAREGKIENWTEHLARVRIHAKLMGLDCPYSDLQLTEVAQGLVSEKKFHFSAVRIQISAGCGARGLEYPENVTVIVTCTKSGNPDEVLPVAVWLETEYRRNETDPTSRIKSGNYGASALIRKQAKHRGYDDVIFLNTKGQVTCASTSNLILEINGGLITPPLEDGVMDGISRAELIKSYVVSEQSVSEQDLKEAEYIWLVNSFGTRPVLKISEVLKETKPLAPS